MISSEMIVEGIACEFCGAGIGFYCEIPGKTPDLHHPIHNARALAYQNRPKTEANSVPCFTRGQILSFGSAVQKECERREAATT